MVPTIDGFSTASDMLATLRTKQVSAVELLELHLRRIEKHNPTLNAIVIPNFDEARRVAREADEKRSQGNESALLGLPLTIKDCIYVKGLVTTGGVPERANAIADADAQLAARVRAAGAVIMGKTNVPPYAGDSQSNNPIFGRTNNPWDLSRTPGGSTGGGAAAVAAGLTPLEFGGDLGGSIRQPAAFCGIYGHRPSETALPRSGHFPGPLTPNPVVFMAAQGPLARSAADLELALDMIAGPEVGEDAAWRIELPRARHARLSDFRVAMMPPLDWLPVDAEIMAALEALAERLRRAGATVSVAQPESFGNLRNYFKTYYTILGAMGNAGTPVAARQAEAERIRSLGDELLNAFADGVVASASDYIIGFGQREAYRAALRAFFRDWDVLLAPANIVNAFPHDDSPFDERTLDVNGQPVAYYKQLVYASLCNFSGHPGTAFPVGLTRAGLPIGLQAIGPYLEDRTPIRFAELVAREFGGYRQPPQFSS